MGEFGECLVDRFSGRPDQLCDLFLCQLVGDAQGAVVLGAEALRKLQQQLGDAAGPVGEEQVGQVVVGSAQPTGQDPQQLLGDFGAISDPCPSGVAVHRDRTDSGDGGGARGPRTGVEDRQFTEHVGRAQDGEQSSPGRSATGCRS